MTEPLVLNVNPSTLRLIHEAEDAYRAGRFGTYAEALRAMLASRDDPAGPLGVHGLGRCARCGESFRLADDLAEVAAGVIHAEEVEDPSELA